MDGSDGGRRGRAVGSSNLPLQCGLDGSEQIGHPAGENPSPAIGLLDPSLFDERGRMLQGNSLRDALAALGPPEPSEDGSVNQQGTCVDSAANNGGSESVDPSTCDLLSQRLPHPLAEDLTCRDDWDWQVRNDQSCVLTPRVPHLTLFSQVRLLVAAAGLEVLSLKRVRVGGLRLPPSLGLGGYR